MYANRCFFFRIYPCFRFSTEILNTIACSQQRDGEHTLWRWKMRSFWKRIAKLKTRINPKYAEINVRLTIALTDSKLVLTIINNINLFFFVVLDAVRVSYKQHWNTYLFMNSVTGRWTLHTPTFINGAYNVDVRIKKQIDNGLKKH